MALTLPEKEGRALYWARRDKLEYKGGGPELGLCRTQRRYLYRYIAFLLGRCPPPRARPGMSELTRAWLEDLACAIVAGKGRIIVRR